MISIIYGNFKSDHTVQYLTIYTKNEYVYTQTLYKNSYLKLTTIIFTIKVP